MEKSKKSGHQTGRSGPQEKIKKSCGLGRVWEWKRNSKFGALCDVNDGEKVDKFFFVNIPGASRRKKTKESPRRNIASGCVEKQIWKRRSWEKKTIESSVRKVSSKKNLVV